MPSLPGLAATIAWPIPTACAPVGSNRKSEPSLPVGACPDADAASIAGSPRLKRSRLIDQHYWNVVPYRVAQTALVAKERLFRFAVLQLAFAFWTNQNFEKTRR